jgi:hypothetical protein
MTTQQRTWTCPLHIQTIPTEAETKAIIQELARYVAGYTADSMTKEALLFLASGAGLTDTMIERYLNYYHDLAMLWTSGNDAVIRLSHRMGIVVMSYQWSNYHLCLEGLVVALYCEGWDQEKLNDVVNKVIADTK